VLPDHLKAATERSLPGPPAQVEGIGRQMMVRPLLLIGLERRARAGFEESRRTVWNLKWVPQETKYRTVAQTQAEGRRQKSKGQHQKKARVLCDLQTSSLVSSYPLKNF